MAAARMLKRPAASSAPKAGRNKAMVQKRPASKAKRKKTTSTSMATRPKKKFIYQPPITQNVRNEFNILDASGTVFRKTKFVRGQEDRTQYVRFFAARAVLQVPIGDHSAMAGLLLRRWPVITGKPVPDTTTVRRLFDVYMKRRGGAHAVAQAVKKLRATKKEWKSNSPARGDWHNICIQDALLKLSGFYDYQALKADEQALSILDNTIFDLVKGSTEREEMQSFADITWHWDSWDSNDEELANSSHTPENDWKLISYLSEREQDLWRQNAVGREYL